MTARNHPFGHPLLPAHICGRGGWMIYCSAALLIVAV